MKHLLAAINLIALLALFNQANAVGFRTVVLKRDIAPGTGNKTFFEMLPGSMNDAGQIAFRSALCCPGDSGEGNWGVWSEAGGSLAIVARSDNPAPGIPTGKYLSNGFLVPSINNVGQTLFHAHTIAPAIDPSDWVNGIWSHKNGISSLVVGGFAHAPGTPSHVQFYWFDSNGILNDNGLIAFSSTLIGTGIDSTNNRGVWTARNGIVSLLARTGESAPGMSSGVVFKSVGDSTVNNLDQILVYGELSGPGIDDSNNDGFWIYESKGPRLIAQTGEVAHGPGNGLVFTRVIPGLNGIGEILLPGTVAGAGVTSSNDQGIWRSSNNMMEQIVRSGDPAPGTEEGVVFDGITDAQMNDVGQISFFSTLRNPEIDGPHNRGGIWVFDQGLVEKVVLSGEQAPGMLEGVRHNYFDGSARLNDLGQIVLVPSRFFCKSA